MFLVLCVSAILGAVKGELPSEESLQSMDTIVKKMEGETTKSSHYMKSKQYKYLSNSNNLVTEDDPNFLPAGFHDFVSSDQGPSYNYESVIRTPSFYDHQPNYYPQVPYDQDWNEMYQHFATNYQYPIQAYWHPVPGDRLPHDDKSRNTKPFQWYPEDVNDNKYPVPEDRLPSLVHYFKSLPDNNEVEIKAKVPQKMSKSDKSRKTRSVKRYFENKPKNFFSRMGWNDINGVDYYRPAPNTHMLSAMKDIMNGNDQYMDHDTSDNGLSTAFDDPLPILVALLIPFSMMLAACLPLLTGASKPNENVPLVSTTATGSRGKILENNSSEFLSPIMAAIGTFSPRTDDEDCILKAFCNVVKSKEPDSLPLQQAIFQASTFIDDSWLDSFGLKTLIESLRNNECGRIQCSKSLNVTNLVFSKPPDKKSK